MGKIGRKVHPARRATRIAEPKDIAKYKPVNAIHAVRNVFCHWSDPPSLSPAAPIGKAIPSSKQIPGTRFLNDAGRRCFLIAATFQKPF